MKRWIVLSLIFLTGCQTKSDIWFEPDQRSAELNAIEMSETDDHLDDLLSLSTSYRHKYKLPQSLPKHLQTLQQAIVATQSHQIKAAKLLQQVEPSSLSPKQQNLYYKNLAKLAMHRGSLDTIISTSPHLSELDLSQKSWSLLGHQTFNSDDEGWQSLNHALLTNNPDELITWHNEHPKHPLHNDVKANPLWPKVSNIHIWHTHPNTQEDEILTESFFTTALNQPHNSLSLSEFIDENNISTFTEHDWIAGNISESKLKELQQKNNKPYFLTTQPLSKNLPHTISIAHSPYLMAQRAMHHARSSGFNHALFLSYSGNIDASQWSQLQKNWQSMGGSTIEQLIITPRQEQQQLKAVFGIHDSAKRIASLQKQIGHELKSKRYVRSDIDVIFLIMDPKQTSVINPLLHYLYVDIPTYTTALMPEKTHTGDYKNLIFNKAPKTVSTKTQYTQMGSSISNIIHRLNLLRYAHHLTIIDNDQKLKLSPDAKLVFSDQIWYTLNHNKILALDLI
ncbi:MAG: penicillin-binding protein activator [Candidatus Comchoanobacterales bacterium]